MEILNGKQQYSTKKKSARFILRKSANNNYVTFRVQ